MANIYGNDNPNTLTDNSTDLTSTIYGRGGNDTIYGGVNVDIIYGGAGDDHIYGGSGNDWLYGEAGNDRFYGDAGADRYDGGSGFDRVTYVNSAAPVSVALDGSFAARGDAIGDTFVSIERIDGTNAGADVIAGNALNNVLNGNAGNDALYGKNGYDVLGGGAGADKLYGGTDASIDLASYYDSAAGVRVSLDGSVTATGQAIGDQFFSIEGLEGSKFADYLVGNSGNNQLYGQEGNDTLLGKDGADTLFGRTGADTLWGGSGADEFAFDWLETGVDQIKDFNLGDKIWVSTMNKALADAALFNPSGFFNFDYDHVSDVSSNRILVDRTNNSLWFDPDGTGIIAPKQFGVLTNNYYLQATDFIVSWY